MSKFDLLIKNGTIIDGTGKDKYLADIGIVDEKIVEIGILKDAKARKIIDAQGKYVAPGFIDSHSHGDQTMLVWPQNENYIMQGVTTIIAGNCGFSPAPIKDVYQFNLWESKAMLEVEPSYMAFGKEQFNLEEAKKAMKKVYDIDIDWSTMGEYFTKVENEKISTNYCPVVGHNQIRTAVMGFDCARPAKPEEIEEMKKLLRQAINDGVIGMSVGLDYNPGMFATTEELLELAKVLKEHDLLYTTHCRSIDVNNPQGGLNIEAGIKETLKIAEETGVKTQVSHIVSAYQIKPKGTPELNKAAAKATIKLIEDSNNKGAKAAYDVIPNIDGGIFRYEYLTGMFRLYVMMAGSLKQFVENLSVADYRVYLEEAIEKVGMKYLFFAGLPNWEECLSIIHSKIKNYEGKTIKEIALEHGKTPISAMLDIIMDDPFTKIKINMVSLVSKEAVKVFTSHPLGMISADIFTCDKDGDFNLEKPLNYAPNPNTFSYTIKAIKEYGKERIEDTIRAMTGYTAEWFGIEDRGTLEKNKFADIVIFNLENLKGYDEEVDYKQYPEGINYVIVNGKLTSENKNHLGIRAGKVLRKN